ncbi:hypothetical protein WA158_005404 [Blastocystis sp. Blastoise]
MRFFEYLLLILILVRFCLSECPIGQIEIEVQKEFHGEASAESFEIWRPNGDSKLKLFSYQSVAEDSGLTKTWFICTYEDVEGDKVSSTTETYHTITMRDSEGNGWGSSTSPAMITIWLYGVLLYSTTMPYKVGKQYYVQSETFQVNTLLDFGSSLHYYISTPAENWFSDTSVIGWYEALPGEFPRLSQRSRYYKMTMRVSNQNSITITFVIRTRCAFIAYLGGREVHRYGMPSGTVTFDTPALIDNHNETVIRTFSVPKSSIPVGIDSLFGIEVHQYQNSTGDVGRIDDVMDIAIIAKKGPTDWSVTCSESTDPHYPDNGCEHLLDPTISAKT